MPERFALRWISLWWIRRIWIGVALLGVGGGLLANPILPAYSQEDSGYSLRFFGHGVDDIDRAKIPVQTAAGSLPTDIGGADFTIEFWIRGLQSENRGAAVTCGSNEDWIYGAIVLDRDRFSEGRKFGLSVDASGRIVFGVTNQQFAARTLCGSSNVLDRRWRHVAVQRRLSDGRLWLFVDGRLEAMVDGPTGDLSYPDGVEVSFRGPQYCQGPAGAWGGYCRNEPFIVLGAEKHDAGASEGNPANYPSFSGWLDELRLSNVLRYPNDFTPPSAPFTADAATVGLYHFDEGLAGPCTGELFDSAVAPGGPTHGACFYGGAGEAGPLYSRETPFTQSPPTGAPPSATPTGTPLPTPTPTRTPPSSTPTNTPSATSTATSTATPTNTPLPPTATNTSGPPTSTATSTATPTATRAATSTPTSTLAANYALQFDGVDDVVLLNPVEHAGTLTVEFWVRPAADWMEVILVSQADEERGWAMELNSGRPALWVSTARGWEVVRHSTRLTGGVWYHVAATYNNGAARVFVNGQPGSAATLSSGLTTASQLRFGGIPGYGRFAGRLDDVRISRSVRYTSSFTPPAILSAPDADVLGQWEFNEGQGQQTASRGSTPNSGQLGLSAEVDAADPTWVIAGR